MVRGLFFLLAVLASTVCFAAVPRPSPTPFPVAPDHLLEHKVVLDSDGKLLPRWQNVDSAYDRVVRLAWDRFKKFPIEPENGHKTYFTYPEFLGIESDPNFMRGIYWVFSPASFFAWMVDGGSRYYAYTGDAEILELIREMLDHHIADGSTSVDDAWAEVPYANTDAGDPIYRGGHDERYCENKDNCGRGDGVGIIEPDKVGELGYGYAQFYQVTREQKYLDAARKCADALVKHVRKGTYFKSPWPFRVDAKTGQYIREQYGTNMIGPVKLFDELIKIGYGDVAAYARVRKAALDWLIKYPVHNNNWSGFFEDIRIFNWPWENVNQYTPLETARYLLLHPEVDKMWYIHVNKILRWVVKTFASDSETFRGLPEKGNQWGAEALSEQVDDMDKMSSHTARYASVRALYYEKTGDLESKEKAFRSFNWASYFCYDNGIVRTSVDPATGFWFSDGYGDYMRHYQSGMASVPEWAPSNENHILSSTSIVSNVHYGEKTVTYETFDASSMEVLKVTSLPSLITAGGEVLNDYTVDAVANGGYVVRIKHSTNGSIQVILQ